MIEILDIRDGTTRDRFGLNRELEIHLPRPPPHPTPETPIQKSGERLYTDRQWKARRVH